MIYGIIVVCFEVVVIKNIIFDLGSVLLREKPISFLKKMNIDDNTYNELKVFFDNWRDIDLGKETLEDKFISCNFSSDIEKEYKDILINNFKYRDINMELIDLINKLKENNYNIYVLSNNNKECYEYFKSNELFKNVDGWIVSCDYGALKEDGNLFDILLNKYNLNPSECFLIDDKLTNIIVGSSKGIKGHIFNEEKDISYLYDDLRNNGFNI